MNKRMKKVVAIVCFFAQLLTLAPNMAVPVTAAEKTSEKTKEETDYRFEGDTFEVAFHVDGKWNNGYNANITITNTGEETIQDWALLYVFEDEIQNLWNGKQIENKYEVTMIKNAEWNQDIEPGKSVSFGFTAGYKDSVHIPKSYSLSTCRKKVSKDDYKIVYKTNSDWKSGYSASMGIQNLTDETIEDWDLQFDFSRNIDSIWNASIRNQTGDTYFLNNSGYNQNIQAKGETYLGFNGTPGDIENNPDNFVLHKYSTEIDPELDSDGDRLPNLYELKVGTNAYRKDTDGDGLDDFMEIFELALDPTLVDTDGNGVKDGDEDTDEDGLTNLQEIVLGTEPADYDTDGDGLCDGEEVNQYKTNPLVKDTDGDTLSDYDDVRLGFSPLKPDTDENGITDDKEKVRQHLSENIEEDVNDGEVTAVSVDIGLTGNIEENTEIENVYGEDMMSSELAGLVGVPVSITTEGAFDTATITFHYDPAKLGDNSEDDLAVMWYDEANGEYVSYEDETVIDKQNHTVSYTTTHFSTYMVFNRKKWQKAWENEINYYKESGQEHYSDIVFAVDASGSMKGPEIKHARNAINSIIDSKRGKDRGCIVSFSKTAEVLTNFTKSQEKLRKGVSDIKPDGATNVDKGLLKAIRQYTKDSYKDVGNKKYILLICDGDMEYNADIVNLAKQHKIAIITVLIGTENESALKKMSKQTGGKFYSVDKAGSIANLLFKLQTNILGEIDTKDSDGDGLYDVFEEKGMMCPNGKIIKTNPYSPDSDFDGVRDYEEMGGAKSFANGKFKKKMKLRLFPTKEMVEIHYFAWKSNPKNSDTDGDGYKDNEDKRPMISDVKVYELKDFVPVMHTVKDKKENYVLTKSYGGDQEWMQYDGKKYSSKGCGLIANTNVVLHWLREHNKNNICFRDKQAIQREVMYKSEYLEFARLMAKYTYVGGTLGSLGHHIRDGLREFSITYDMPLKTYEVRSVFMKNPKEILQKLLRKRLKNKYASILGIGAPLVAYFPGGKDVDKDNKLKMYRSTQAYVKFEEANKLYDHFVTVTGMVINKQEKNTKLIVSSWGKKFFVDLDECYKYANNYGDHITCDLIVYYPRNKS